MPFGKPKIDSKVFIPQLNARLERLSDGNVVIHLGNTGTPKPVLFFCTKCSATHQVPKDAFADIETLLNEATWAENHKHVPQQPDISSIRTGTICPVAEQAVCPVLSPAGGRKLKTVV